MKEARYIRARKIVENLNRQGIDLRFETVLATAGIGAIGRPHIAAALLKEELVYSFREAFEKYLGYGLPAYVEKYKMHPGEVFDLVKQAGGVPVLAHPGVTGIDGSYSTSLSAQGFRELRYIIPSTSADKQEIISKLRGETAWPLPAGRIFTTAAITNRKSARRKCPIAR